MKELLKNLGLTNHEATVYLELLKLSSVLASNVAEKTKINRSLTYTILTNLIDKGLVSYNMKENRKYFMATKPEKLLEILKEKELRIKEQKNKIEKILPKLKKLQIEVKEQKIEIYKGKQGLKTIFEDILRTNKNYVAYGSGGLIEEILDFYFPNFIKRRAKQKLKTKLIFNISKKPIKHPLTKIRYLMDEYHSPCDTIIYGDKVAILFLIGGLTGLVIESKELAQGYKNHFNLLWNIAKEN